MRTLFILFLSILMESAGAAGGAVTGVEASFDGAAGRVEMTVEGPVEYHWFTLERPDRLVVDFAGAKLKGRLPRNGIAGTPVKRVRHGYRQNGAKLRLVVELERAPAAKPKLTLEGGRVVARFTIAAPVPSAVHQSPGQPVRSIRQIAKANDLRDVVVAIDAGHGGKDVGAEGPGGVYEKDVVLAVARKLEKLIEREPGMRPVMIRDGDYFLRLRTRMKRAREAKADLFISLHANSFSDPKVGGTSVYVLSDRGATSEAARWLAQKENDADLIGGVSLDDKEDSLSAVLLDLAQNATLEDSIVAAGEVLSQFKHRGRVHKRNVERAGFLVLKSPDVPSMLVELAFISNPREERQLSSSYDQSRMARSLVDGVRRYFAKNAPPGTRLAEQNRQRRERVTSVASAATGG
ncbi:N-acetylmuramoyl-L-alanine amidase [Endothiovibrio diazotrophicus]